MLDQSIAVNRDALKADFEPRAVRALERWPVTVSEREIGGVSCQIIDPENAAPKGTLLYLFGGGYVSGCPEFDLPITAALCALGSLRIVAPRYGLAPEYPFPAGLYQCVAVYDALAIETGTQPLFVSGESAGGGMALAVTRAAASKGLNLPARLALFSPWSDLTEDGIALSEGIDDPTITTTDLRTYASAYLDKTPADDVLASPGLAPHPEPWPDTILTTGSRDILQPSVLALTESLRGTGASVDLINRPEMCHVFEVYDELPDALPSLRQVADFLTSR